MGSTVSLPAQLKLFCSKWRPYWRKKNLLTSANFHTVDSQALKGCELKSYINSPLFSLSARVVQAPLPLIWHLVCWLVINRPLCALPAPERCGWEPGWNLCVRVVCTSVYTREGDSWEEYTKDERERAFVNIPPRVPHFLGTGVAGF